jgi:hypothetical protein
MMQLFFFSKRKNSAGKIVINAECEWYRLPTTETNGPEADGTHGTINDMYITGGRSVEIADL